MPAVIAVKVNHAKSNTQGAVKKAENKKIDSAVEKSAKDTVSADFKKLIDKKIEKNKEQAVKKTGKQTVGKNKDIKKSEKDLKLSTGKFSEIQSEIIGNPEKLTDDAKIENKTKLELDLNTETDTVLDKETHVKTNQLLTAAFQSSSKLSASDGKKINKSDKTEVDISAKNSKKAAGEEKEETKFQVLDLRSSEKSDKKSENNSFSFDSSNEKVELNSQSSEQKTENNQFKDLLYIKAEAGSGIKAEPNVKSLTAQQSEVLERLKSDGNSEIVKQTKIILNDANSGELKMILRPEKLGFVRIKLNLDDNNIVGRIIVDNNSIKEIFENNMESLLRNFKESGFGSASLEVSVGGGKNQQQNMDSNERFFSKKIIEDVDNQNIVGRSITDDSLIDLVV